MNSAIVFSRPTGSSPEPQKSSRLSAESPIVSLVSTEWMLLAGNEVIAVRPLTANLTNQEDTRSARICTEPRIRALSSNSSARNRGGRQGRTVKVPCGTMSKRVALGVTVWIPSRFLPMTNEPRHARTRRML